jgi:ankyrin repeat protein
VAKRTTIFDAIATGDPAKVKRKLAREPEALAERDENGLSPLMRALYEGNPEVVEAVLARDPELDVFEASALGRRDELRRLLGRSRKRAGAYSPDGFTPLHLAAYFGHVDAAALLLERGAEVDARSKNPQLRSLTPLHSAAASRSTEVAVLLLDAGADPNATQPGGWTALHAAAANGNLELCKVLLRRKAKRSPLADDRSRPLDFAVENGHAEIVRLLKRG